MNEFCGPYAYAKLLGISTDEAEQIIRKFDFRYVGNGPMASKPVKGLLGSAMREALKATGKVIAQIPKPHMTLRTFIEAKIKKGDDHVWMVFVTGHFVLYRRGMVYDNNNPHGKPYNLHISAKRRIREATCIDLWSDLNPYTGNFHP